MAKKKKKGAGAQDTDDMSKSELKAYHQEICDYYLEHGWRDTLSNYALSPAQAGEITEKVRKKKDKAEAEEKAKRKKAKGKKKEKAPKKKSKEKAAAPKKKKKDKKKAEPKAKAPKKKTKAKKKSGKKRGRPPGKTAGKQKIQEPTNIEGALDFLLNYRSTNGPVTLDEAIVDLTLRSRAA